MNPGKKFVGIHNHLFGEKLLEKGMGNIPSDADLLGFLWNDE